MTTMRNIGETRLIKRRRSADPMRAYDSLPQPLRTWMAQAALPWSPASCRRLWLKARAEGATLDTILDRLDRAEAQTLSRDRTAPSATAASEIHDKQDHTI
ncbi:MAG: DUF6525 family protein [Sedimentitalea sp.]|uniref:DUF6525 family protein n=1 Tax=Sedimentitalea sp. TaxID=2048915 RepID=UPI003265B918